MNLFGDDTSPEAAAFLIARYRQLSPSRRAEIWSELQRAGDQLGLAGLKTRFADEDEGELRRRLALSKLPPSLRRRFLAHEDSRS
ncbi:MAG: hypothetical protein HN348_28740 [Proteobacteria bacterium]|jgi:hypothetical protein|nr:hypothetical protein [Pseudomonadota bacterium]